MGHDSMSMAASIALRDLANYKALAFPLPYVVLTTQCNLGTDSRALGDGSDRDAPGTSDTHAGGVVGLALRAGRAAGPRDWTDGRCPPRPSAASVHSSAGSVQPDAYTVYSQLYCT